MPYATFLGLISNFVPVTSLTVERLDPQASRCAVMLVVLGLQLASTSMKGRM
jgi:hypothetical protein